MAHMRKLSAAAAVATVPASLIAWLAEYHRLPLVAAAVVGALIGSAAVLAVDAVARRRRRSSSSSRCARCQRLAGMPSAPCPACPDNRTTGQLDGRDERAGYESDDQPR